MSNHSKYISMMKSLSLLRTVCPFHCRARISSGKLARPRDRSSSTDAKPSHPKGQRAPSSSVDQRPKLKSETGHQTGRSGQSASPAPRASSAAPRTSKATQSTSPAPRPVTAHKKAKKTGQSTSPAPRPISAPQRASGKAGQSTSPASKAVMTSHKTARVAQSISPTQRSALAVQRTGKAGQSTSRRK